MSKKKCSLSLDADDVEGLNWLLKVLNAIKERGPEHRNYERARKAAWALDKLQDLNDVHEAVHKLSDIDELDIARIHMTTQDRGEA